MDHDRHMAAFWFSFAGVMMVFSGLLLYQIEILMGGVPWSITIAFAVMTLFGCIMAPKSGFTTLLLPQVIYLLLS